MAEHTQYPAFSKGDVLIVSPHGNTWNLYAHDMCTNSAVLAKVLSYSSAKQVGNQERMTRDSTPHKLGMVFSFTDKNAPAKFVVLDLNEPLPIPPVDNLRQPPGYLTTYDNLFRCMNNLDPKLSTQHEEEAIADCLELLNAAESLGALQCTRHVIEAHLLRTGPFLWKLIATSPEAWCDFSFRIQSPPLFREAMCHIVGAWNMKTTDKSMLQNSAHGKIITNLVESKILELNDIKRGIEIKVLELFPVSMLHSPDVKGRGINRSVYAEDIYQWQALTIIRQYLATAIVRNQHHPAPDGGATLYRQITRGNAAYISRANMDDFFGAFSMTKRGRECLDHAIQHVKGQLQPLVAPLMIDRTEVGKGRGGLRFPYLTCVEIKDGELPWAVEGGGEGEGAQV